MSGNSEPNFLLEIKEEIAKLDKHLIETLDQYKSVSNSLELCNDALKKYNAPLDHYNGSIKDFNETDKALDEYNQKRYRIQKNSIESKIGEHCEHFFKLCDKLSYNMNALSAGQKKDYYSQISKISRIFLHTYPNVKDIFIKAGHKHTINKSIIFLEKYISLRQPKYYEVENYREFIQQIAKEKDLSKIIISSEDGAINGKNISQLYDEAYLLKVRGKREKANTCLKQIQKFLDQEAFKHLAIIYNDYFNAYDREPSALKDKYIEIKKELFKGGTLSELHSRFSKEYNQFFTDLFSKNYTSQFVNSYNSILCNPFNIITNGWYDILIQFPEPHIIMAYISNRSDASHDSERPLTLFTSLSDLINDDVFVFNLTVNNVRSLNIKTIDKQCHDWNIISSDSFREAVKNFTLSDEYTDLFEKTASPQEKADIAPHPDHPTNEPIEIVGRPDQSNQKIKIVDHGENPEISLEDQVPDRSKEQEDIKDIYSLPPSEALKDQTLTEAFLSYSFLKIFPSLKNTASYLTKSFASIEKFFKAYTPKFSFATKKISKTQTTQPTRYFMNDGIDVNSSTTQNAGSNGGSRAKSKVLSATKNVFTPKGGFILSGVFISLEVLQARLENAGYKRAASCVPVTSNFRPWGEAYFSTVDYNLGVDPAAGYSTTRLFTHIADGTAYVFEGIGNIIHTAGKAERAFYRSIATEKNIGVDPGYFGIINGTTEAVGSFIDGMGGSLKLRREKAQSKFRSNISSYETSRQKKIRLSKTCMDRGLSHYPKQNKANHKIKKISGTTTQTKQDIARSFIEDYSALDSKKQNTKIEAIPHNRNPFKSNKTEKETYCFNRYLQNGPSRNTSLPNKKAPKPIDRSKGVTNIFSVE